MIEEINCDNHLTIITT